MTLAIFQHLFEMTHIFFYSVNYSSIFCQLYLNVFFVKHNSKMLSRTEKYVNIYLHTKWPHPMRVRISEPLSYRTKRRRSKLVWTCQIKLPHFKKKRTNLLTCVLICRYLPLEMNFSTFFAFLSLTLFSSLD